jgi:hypothetical protein
VPTVLADLPTRIAAAAKTARDADASARLAHDQLHQLIVEAVDEGMPQRAVAKAAGWKSAGRVTAVLGKTHAVDGVK